MAHSTCENLPSRVPSNTLTSLPNKVQSISAAFSATRIDSIIREKRGKRTLQKNSLGGKCPTDTSYMTHPTVKQLTVLDLVPFGNPGGNTAFYALRLSPPEWETWKPGQFVMIKPANGGSELLWGRPFSICRVSRVDMVLFFQVVGRGTTELSKLQAGDELTVWGPLGNYFAMEAQTPTLILAGGIGLAPFVGYVQTHPSPWDIQVEFGHRMPVECYPADSINEKAMMEAHHEKNPQDRKAFLEVVDKRMQEYTANGLVLACGPTPFLREVQRFALKYKTRTQLCLETRMACGVGACLGCVVKAARQGTTLPANGDDSSFNYMQTCTCGPNFWADRVSF